MLLPLVPEDIEAQLAAAGVGVAAAAAEHAHHSHRQGGGAAGGGSSFAAAGPGQEQQGEGVCVGWGGEIDVACHIGVLCKQRVCIQGLTGRPYMDVCCDARSKAVSVPVVYKSSYVWEPAGDCCSCHVCCVWG